MRTLQAMILGLGLAAASAWAQVAADPADPKKAEAPKKAEPKKAQPKKAEAPKKTEPKKTDPNVKVFKAGAKDAPVLRDKQGNVIPTNPEAYDVSSATKK